MQEREAELCVEKKMQFNYEKILNSITFSDDIKMNLVFFGNFNGISDGHVHFRELFVNSANQFYKSL